MLCPECQKIIPGGSRFCLECGSPVSPDSCVEPRGVAARVGPSLGGAAPHTGLAAAGGKQPEPQRPAAMRRRRLWLAGATAALTAAALLAWLGLLITRHHRFFVAVTEAQRLLKAERWEGAEAAFQKALKVNGYEQSTEARAGLAKTQDGAAHSAFDAACAEGDQLLGAKQWAQGEVAFHRALAVPGHERDSRAVKGLAEAQYSLGRDCWFGAGVQKDQTEAVRWFRKAAAQGHAGAQNSLGACYAFGTGVDKNETEAAKLYRLAAEQGDGAAQGNLALCYQNGTGVEEDEREAVRWFRSAAEQNIDQAQFSLGQCYSTGAGVTKDEAEAVNWYRKAVEQGFPAAKDMLTRMGK